MSVVLTFAYASELSERQATTDGIGTICVAKTVTHGCHVTPVIGRPLMQPSLGLGCDQGVTQDPLPPPPPFFLVFIFFQKYTREISEACSAPFWSMGDSVSTPDTSLLGYKKLGSS